MQVDVTRNRGWRSFVAMHHPALLPLATCVPTSRETHQQRYSPDELNGTEVTDVKISNVHNSSRDDITHANSKFVCDGTLQLC
jgi:hypothetical protein